MCVYGGTSAGVMAAYSASRMGADVVLVCPDKVLGGMTTGGLGYTDVGNRKALQGLARQFYRKIGEHYGRVEQNVFEPHVAQEVIDGYAAGLKIDRGRYLERVEMDGTKISAIVCSGKRYAAKQFIDCTYEGDLMAASGVSYRTGRESAAEYGECWNGAHESVFHQFPDGIDPYNEPGNPDSGLLWGISDRQMTPEGEGDDLIQAYNFRICLTDVPENRIELGRPENYDPAKYELLGRFARQCPDLEILHLLHWGMMPGRKTDINNYGGFSTDMIGFSQGYPEGTREEREAIIKEHYDYTLGLLYFLGHDPRIPAEAREKVLSYGLPKDEYPSTGHWTHQLYVRESRRMVGEYVVTQADCEGLTEVEDPVAMAAYSMDSHNCERVVVVRDGRAMVKNEGDVERWGVLPYNLPYRCLTPRRAECTNLLVPVCLSASHIAYGSIRMEPVFMATGQVAGMAAAIAKDADIQSVDSEIITSLLDMDPCLDGSQPYPVIDDSDSDLVRSEGWKTDVHNLNYGPTALLDTGEGILLEYSMPHGIEGEYDIYAFQSRVAGLCARMTYDIDGRSFVFERDSFEVVGQAVADWAYIGTCTLGPSSKIRVSAVDASEDAKGFSDSIMLVPVNKQNEI